MGNWDEVFDEFGESWEPLEDQREGSPVKPEALGVRGPELAVSRFHLKRVIG